MESVSRMPLSKVIRVSESAAVPSPRSGPMKARVVISSTGTLAVPAMPADPPPPIAPLIDTMSSVELALTSTLPFAATCAAAPILASVSLVMTGTSAPAPIPALPPPARAPARPNNAVSSLARTSTSCSSDPPPARFRRAPRSTKARVVSLSTVTVADPAPPAVPPPAPATAAVRISSLELATTETPRPSAVERSPRAAASTSALTPM